MEMRMPIDLRSDTVTRPTEGMRRAMACAEVGDDVFGEDPTVRRLEEVAAGRLGFEAGLFVPTGTMGNQVALQLHAPRGTDVIVEADCHVYRYELGAMAAWSGVLPRVLSGRGGRLELDQVSSAIAPDTDYLAPTSCLVLENTHNHAGGVCIDLEHQRSLIAAAHRQGVKVHLDGARIFNAAAALGVTAADVAAGFDSVMFCLSKGLGAPVGSVLVGPAGWIAQARVVRKRMGGGMRQVGILAAAGLYALEHHVERLSDDHRRAARLAEEIGGIDAFVLDPSTVQTNMVSVGLRRPDEQSVLLKRLDDAGVLAIAMGPDVIRFVTHLDIDDASVETAVAALRKLRV